MTQTQTISPLRQRMIEDMSIRNLSPTTQRSYIGAVRKFSTFFGKSPDKLTLEDVRRYQVHLVSQKVAWATLNQQVCALRFFYRVTLGRKDLPERIPYARRPKTLPEVLSQDEIVRFLSAVRGLENRVALTSSYAMGLRISELVNIKIEDIDGSRGLVHIHQGKGGRDRYVTLSKKLHRILRCWWKLERPKCWLFPGNDQDRHISRNVLYQQFSF